MPSPKPTENHPHDSELTAKVIKLVPETAAEPKEGFLDSQREKAMKVVWVCERCGGKFTVPHDAFGTVAECPHCCQPTKLVEVAALQESGAWSGAENSRRQTWVQRELTWEKGFGALVWLLAFFGWLLLKEGCR